MYSLCITLEKFEVTTSELMNRTPRRTHIEQYGSLTDTLVDTLVDTPQWTVPSHRPSAFNALYQSTNAL